MIGAFVHCKQRLVRYYRCKFCENICSRHQLAINSKVNFTKYGAFRRLIMFVLPLARLQLVLSNLVLKQTSGLDVQKNVTDQISAVDNYSHNYNYPCGWKSTEYRLLCSVHERSVIILALNKSNESFHQGSRLTLKPLEIKSQNKCLFVLRENHEFLLQSTVFA